MNSVRPKKKNLFAFFKSKEFDEARVKMCAMYIILSYANELHEDIDRLLQGFDGLYIGDLKHASKVATRTLEAYDKQYLAHINGDGSELCDATVDVTSAIGIQMQQSQFFLQEATKAMYKAINEQVEKRVKDPEELKREAAENFEICRPIERKQALDEALRLARKRIAEFNGDPIKGVEVGFNIAINWINRLYLEA